MRGWDILQTIQHTDTLTSMHRAHEQHKLEREKKANEEKTLNKRKRYYIHAIDEDGNSMAMDFRSFVC